MDDERATIEPPQLLAVHAFDVTGDFEGGRWWITAVERWTDATALQYVIWTEQSNLNSPTRHTPDLGAGYLRSHVSLTDDVGTFYEFVGGGSGTSGMGGQLLRGHAGFRTPLPPTARSLVATLHRLPPGTPDAQVVASMNLDLGGFPSR